jgi:MFS family permease
MRLLERWLINRNYARLWYAQAVSNIGDFVFDTTLILWIATILAKGRPWAPAAVSGVVLAVGGAVLLAAPIAGVLVDRMDRRRVLLRSETVRACLVGALAVVSFVPSGALPVWLWLVMIYVTVFCENVAGQFFGPARFVVLSQVVEGDVDRARAAGIGYATGATAAVLGPPLAAPLLFTIGLQFALIINALSYVFSYFAIRSVRFRPQEPPVAAEEPASAAAGKEIRTLRGDFVAGLRFVAGSRYLVALIVIMVICQAGTGALAALDVFFVTDNLHAPAHLYGLVAMTFGIGSIVGALSSGRVVKWFGARNTTIGALVLSGLIVMLYAKQTNFAVGLVMFGLVALPISASNTALTPILMAVIPEKFMGRVTGVLSPVNQLATMVSVVVASWLASTVLLHFNRSVAGVHFGRMDTLFFLGGVLILFGGLYSLGALPAETTTAAAATEAAVAD